VLVRRARDTARGWRSPIFGIASLAAATQSNFTHGGGCTTT
jgi:hypothetical protein